MQGEYRGDFTRDTFYAANHFSRVLMPTRPRPVGRRLERADRNSASFLAQPGSDLIGQHGGPANNWGFEITQIDGVANDFALGPGHYYVDGILCEIEQSQAVSVNAFKKGTKQIVVTNPREGTGMNFRTGDIVEIPADSPGSSRQFVRITDANGGQLTLSSPAMSQGA